MREFLVEEGEPVLGFVGSATITTEPENVARDMRRVLGFTAGWAAHKFGVADTHVPECFTQVTFDRRNKV